MHAVRRTPNAGSNGNQELPWHNPSVHFNINVCAASWHRAVPPLAAVDCDGHLHSLYESSESANVSIKEVACYRTREGADRLLLKIRYGISRGSSSVSSR